MEAKDIKPIEVATTRQIVSWSRREIKTRADFLNLFREYYESNPRVLSLKGFSIYVGMGAIPKYAEVFKEEYAFIKEIVEKEMVERALIGDFNAGFTQFLLKSSFGYTTPDIEITQTTVSSDDIAKIKQSLRNLRENKDETRIKEISEERSRNQEREAKE